MGVVIVALDGGRERGETVVDGKVIATGHAVEKYDADDNINVSCFLENAETSAVGRALGFVGIGINSSIAPANDVVATDKDKKVICKNCGKEIEPYNKNGNIVSPIDIFTACNGFCINCYRANKNAEKQNSTQIKNLTPEVAASFEVRYIEAAKQRPFEGKKLCELSDSQLTNLSMKNMLSDQTKQAIKVIMEA